MRWVIKVSLSLCRAQFICSYYKQISCIMRLLWVRVPWDSNDMHWYTCYIPDCSLIDVHYLASVDSLLSSSIKCNYCACVGDSFEFRQTGEYSFYVMDINKCFQAKLVQYAPLFIFILAFLYDKECPVDFWKKNLGYFSFYGYFCWNRDTSQCAKNTEDAVEK